MALQNLQDLMIDGFDAGLWNVSKTDVSLGVNAVNDQIECDNAGTAGNAGLITKAAYDMSAGSLASIVVPRIDRNFSLYLLPTDSQNLIPYTELNWYRISMNNGEYWCQKNVAGTITTILNSFTSAPPVTMGISLPATGDEVRFLINGSEVDTDATFELATRDLFIQLDSYTDDGAQENHFTTFNATYEEAVSGATISNSPASAVLGNTLTFAIANGTVIGSGAPVGTVVDINGYPLTITSYPPSGTGNIICNVDCEGLYDPLAILTYTDANTSNDQVLIDLQQQAGFDVVTLSGALATDDGYVLFGTTGFADGDQIEVETITNLTVLATSEWDWSTEPLVTVTMDWYLIDATDGVRTGPFVATFTVSALSLPILRRRREAC